MNKYIIAISLLVFSGVAQQSFAEGLSKELGEALGEGGSINMHSLDRKSRMLELPLLGKITRHHYQVIYQVWPDISDQQAHQDIMKLIKADMQKNQVLCQLDEQKLQLTRQETKEYAGFDAQLDCDSHSE